jgi:hypothetical protein
MSSNIRQNKTIQRSEIRDQSAPLLNVKFVILPSIKAMSASAF